MPDLGSFYMDIFESYGVKLLLDYLKSYVETLPHLSNSRFHLSRRQTMEDMIPVTVCDDRSKSERDIVDQYLRSFYKISKEANPFVYFSKLKFVSDHKDNKEFWCADLFFHLISDRCLYFYDRREFAATAKSCGLFGLVLKCLTNPNIEDTVKCIGDGVEHVSSLHLEYLKENQSNFQKLTQAMRLKEQHFSISDNLLKELNRVGKECKKSIGTNGTPSIEDMTLHNKQKEQTFTKIVEIIKIYVASVIWKTRKKEYIHLLKTFSSKKTRSPSLIFII